MYCFFLSECTFVHEKCLLWKYFENKARLRYFYRLKKKTVYMVCLWFDKITNVFCTFTFDIYLL